MTSVLASIGNPFIPLGGELRPFAVELTLIATIVAVLIAPFFTKRSNFFTAIIAILGLAASFCMLPMAASAGTGGKFYPLLVSDSYAIFWKGMLLLFVIGVILMWFSTTASTMHEGDGPEFFTLLLGATLGMCLMASTTNLLMIFIAVEMASLPSYVMAGFRKTDRIGSEASLKYVLFGAATSAVMVYGLSMLYGLFGTLQVEQLAVQAMQAPSVPLIVGIAGILIGIGFKVSAVPFHFWCPDVFEGASIEVTTFLSVASKGAGISLLLRVLMSIATASGFDPSSKVLVGAAIVVGILGAITATVGNTGAFVQNNIKRLLAYSSIAHAGYMLCAAALLVKTASAARDANLANVAAQAILMYLAVYLFMNLGAFTVAGMIAKETGTEDISGYAGLGRRSPVLAVCMAACLFSLVGIPPFAGFVAKWNIIFALGKGGGWFWILVAVIGVNTVFSLYFYARVIRKMFLEPSDAREVAGNPLGTLISVVCAGMLVLMLVGYGSMYRLTTAYGKVHVPPFKAPMAVVAQEK